MKPTFTSYRIGLVRGVFDKMETVRVRLIGYLLQNVEVFAINSRIIKERAHGKNNRLVPERSAPA